MFEFGAFSSILLACGGFLGWRPGTFTRDRGLEVRSQVADINWLRAKLTDSEKRCAQQAEWLNSMEAELTAHRALDASADVPAQRAMPRALVQIS